MMDEFLGKFVVIYFNANLVYNTNLDEHLYNLKFVLFVLEKKMLYYNLKKCFLCKYHVVFLEFMITSNTKKIKTIQE